MSDEQILVPVSIGELYDKITILRIKSERLDSAAKLENVRYELSELERVADEKVAHADGLDALVLRLQEINAALWDIEDGKRQAERDRAFDDAFIHLARQVYIMNDQRAAVKREINELLGSTVVEEKSYSTY